MVILLLFHFVFWNYYITLAGRVNKINNYLSPYPGGKFAICNLQLSMAYAILFEVSFQRTDTFAPKNLERGNSLMETFRDTYGNRIARQENNRILNRSGDWTYEIVGNRINDPSGNWKYEIRNDRVYDTSGNWVYELRGDRVYDTNGNWLGSEY